LTRTISSPVASDTYAGRAAFDEIIRKFRRGTKRGLSVKVLNEFEPRPSGLVLPENKVVKRFEGERIERVVWKIVRGLYFHHHSVVLPGTLPVHVSLTRLQAKESPPEHFLHFMAAGNPEDHARYPGAFGYRFANFGDVNYWALLIWDCVLVTAMFEWEGGAE
jgi:hypothetical protein